MCCFSGRAGAVREVSGTRIFARSAEGNLQALIYEMRVSLREPVAMVLPLPVAPGSGEHALQFVSLEQYPEFFVELDRAFPPPPGLAMRGPVLRGPAPRSRLVVHAVGAFVASYVPSAADFDRLDPRFRLAPGVLESLPQYRDWGFAVFQLDAEPLGLLRRLFGPKPPAKKIHPMAFFFPRRDPDTLFFPTVHVHDGEVHPTAAFDHSLYLQMDGAVPAGWTASDAAPGSVVSLERARGLVGERGSFARLELHGVQTNDDVKVRVGGPVGAAA